MRTSAIIQYTAKPLAWTIPRRGPRFLPRGVREHAPFPNPRSFLYNEPSMIVGSRGSALALRQTGIVVEAVERLNPGVKCRIEVIKTTGDRILDKPLAKIGDKGLFVKEIEAALIAGEIDFAVHSAKDLPSEMDERLCIAAFPEREPATRWSRMRWCRRWDEAGRAMDLPQRARVGTSSMRRRAQLLAVRPDLEIIDLRGNLDTRLRKLDEGCCDAVVLACAGLVRMGLAGRCSGFPLRSDPETPVYVLPYEICLPAAGAGGAWRCSAGRAIRRVRPLRSWIRR